MSSHHNYNTSNNSQASSETNDNPENNPTPCETSDLILNLEKKLLSRFDGLDKEILNLKDIVIKELQLENQPLRNKVSDLQKKIYSAEENINSLELSNMKCLQFLIGEILITCIGKNCSPTYHLPFKTIFNFFLSNCLMQWEKGLKYDKIYLHCVFLNHINALLAIFE